MNDTQIETYNPILKTVYEIYDRLQYIRYLQGCLSENNHTKISTMNTHQHRTLTPKRAAHPMVHVSKKIRKKKKTQRPDT
jgi:hypothetical protein